MEEASGLALPPENDDVSMPATGHEVATMATKEIASSDGGGNDQEPLLNAAAENII